MFNSKKLNELSVRRIDYQKTKHLILNVHYAKRMPSISYAYGLFDKDELIGICTFGSPASPFLCKGVCGEVYRTKVVELNRLVLVNNRNNEASYLVGKSIKLLPKPRIIVSYADTAQGHIGIVYQATNFIYTGATKPRTDMASPKGKHSRHHGGDRSKRVFRSSKHRYIYMHGSKSDRKALLKALRYKVQDYPKVLSNRLVDQVLQF